MSHITINKNKCKSCYLCVDVCPKNLIKISNIVGKTGEYIVEFDDKDNSCLACAQCAMMCPDLAIEEVNKQ